MKLESHQVLEMYEYILQTRKEIFEKSGEKTDKPAYPAGRLVISRESGSDLTNYMTRLMVRLRKQNKLIVNAKQIRASVIVKWLKQYNLKTSTILSRPSIYRIDEMEGLTEEVNKFHPLG